MVGIRSFLAASAVSVAACSSVPEHKLVDTAGNPATNYSGASDTSAASALAKVPVGLSPVRGPDDAWATMIEFGDFECPYCAAEEPVLQTLLAEYSSDLRLVFKHFPLTDIHPFAQGAAIAAQCAASQGAFWPMHDLLLENQDALDSEDLPGYALSAGVDLPSWQQCLSTQPPVDAVFTDVALGTAAGVRGTPTFLLNGLRIQGGAPQAELETSIDRAIAQAQASGVPSSQYYDTVILAP